MAPSRRLAIPTRLHTTLLLTAIGGCTGSTMPVDANDTGSDASDLVANDVPTVCDAMPYAPGTYQCLPDPHADAAVSCPTGWFCTNDRCGTGCVACITTFEGVGYTCLPDSTSDATITCPNMPVCDPADCPSGCVACASPLFCIPMSSTDSATPFCNPASTCDPSGCPPGCMAEA